MTVRLDRLQQGLFDALAGVTDVVTWVRGEQPRDPGGLLSLSLTAGPIPGLRQRARGRLLLPADSITVRVTAATNGNRVVVRLNGFDYRHDVGAGESVTDVRNALLAAILLGEAGAVTPATNGADGVDLVADFLGGLRSLTLHGDLSSEAAVFSDDGVLETIGTVTHTVTLQAFSQQRYPRNGAHAIIDAALDRLQRRSVVDELCRYGVALWDTGAAIDLSAIAGGHWESRVAVDVTVATRTVSVEPVDQIETLTADITISGETVSASASAP
jgi:hypothetical protein